MFEVQILALINREIEEINNGIEGPYLVRVRAAEPRQRLQIFDPNLHQMGSQLEGEVEWDGFVAKVAKILRNFELEDALMEEESLRRKMSSEREKRECVGGEGGHRLRRKRRGFA